MYVSNACDGCGYLVVDDGNPIKDLRCICIKYKDVPHVMYADNFGMGEKHTIYGRLRICSLNNERDLFTIKRDERKTSILIDESMSSIMSSVSAVCNKE